MSKRDMEAARLRTASLNRMRLLLLLVLRLTQR